MKKEANLKDSKELMHDENISLNDKNGFYSYNESIGLTVEFSKLCTFGETDNCFYSDYKFRSFDEYTDGMNMHFDGVTSVIFGNFRKDTNGPVFTIIDPKDAKQVLIAVSWDANVNEYSDYDMGEHYYLPEEAASALFFSDDGYNGYDYYILNVGHVFGQPDRDVSCFLEEMSNLIKSEEHDYDLASEISANDKPYEFQN